MVEEKTLTIDTNQIVNLRVESEIDDSNLRDPHGYECGERSGFFNRKIVIENIGQEVLKGIDLIINDKDFSTFRGLMEYLKTDNSQSSSIKKIYSFCKDNFFHATSDTKENHNPICLLNFWGYGLCYDSAVALMIMSSYQDIPSRQIHLNGHTVFEHFFENKWNIIDGDQNVVYIKLDNKTLASFKEIQEDPFIALRSKVFGKYNLYNLEKSWGNTAIFEFISPRENPIQRIDKKKLEIQDTNTPKWILFPGEKIIFHYDESPEVAIGKSDISAWGKAKDIALGIIQIDIDTTQRRKITKSDSIVIQTKYPIYKIVDHISESSMYLPKEQVCTQVNLKCGENAKQMSVFCHGSRESFPTISKGENVISLKVRSGSGKTKITFKNNMFKEDMCLPQVRVVNLSSIFKYEPPFFDIEGIDDIERIWWQICDHSDFQFVIPNYDCIQEFSKRIKLSRIDDTFLNNNEEYYFRVKARSKGVWGEWSSPFKFKVIKPNQPDYVKYTLLSESIIKVSWDGESSEGLEYLVFGSNRLDFVPDIYVEKQINRMTDVTVEEDSINKNLIMVTLKNYCVLDDKNLFYRIIACKGHSFSTPSAILTINSRIGDTEHGYNFPEVLQNRHTIVRGDEYKNGYKDIHEAKVMKLSIHEKETIEASMY